ncbi:MAG: hypothetical protein FWG60_01785 [Methanomassiliicoccaceae archaeon]|nr:hypothetical protein [Methanomassiliicoccaceae archaeon]
MMSIKISPEAEELREALWNLMEMSNIDIFVRLEAFLAIAVEYADFYIEINKGRIDREAGTVYP